MRGSKAKAGIGLAAGLFLVSLLYGGATSAADRTPIKLTPEQEAYFPKNDPIDAALLEKFNHPWRIWGWDVDERQLGSRYPLYYVSPIVHDTYIAPICRDLLRNSQLNGGAIVGGCNGPDLNDRLPDKNLYKFPAWQVVDPLKHLDIIRSIFIDAQSSALEEFQNPVVPNYYWYKMAPIIRHLLTHHQLSLQRTTLDLLNKGNPKTVYALKLEPYDLCIKADGTKTADISFLYIDGTDPASRGFNRIGMTGSPFLYSGEVPNEIYLSVKNGVTQPTIRYTAVPSNDVARVTGVGVCDFQDLSKVGGGKEQ
jgi:hypothetical protein